jgi:uroporphyrinogen decarboxylase
VVREGFPDMPFLEGGAMLSQLECFEATVSHKTHEGFLFYANFTPSQQERIRRERGWGNDESLRDCFEMFVPGMVAPSPPGGWPRLDASGYFQDIEIPSGAFINALGVLEIPGSLYHFTRYVSPLRNARSFGDIEGFPFPGVNELETGHLASQVREYHSRGRVADCPVGHIYEDAWQIRGYEAFLLDMLDRPQWCELILDKLKEKKLAIALAAAKAGVDYIITGDDVANQRSLMFSPALWRRFIKSRWAEIYHEVRRVKPDIQIWYHSDGNIEPIIPELIDVGVTILNPVQPECLNPLRLKKRFGRRIVIDGTIGTQTTMPFGSPDEVRRVVTERIDTLGYDGALILSPTHVLEPEVPLRNIEAFVDAVKAHGSLR